METAVQLFARKQVAALTGIPDDILNYWMREGVLRAREGGEGRGQHRRFDYPEVTLAALLDQLRGFGLGLPALKKLAQRFHDARDYMAALGVTRQNYDPLDNLIRIKRDVLEHGSAQVFVKAGEEFPGLPVTPSEYGSSFVVQVTLDDAMQHPKTWLYPSWKGDHEQVLAIARRIIGDVDPDCFRSHWAYWSLLTLLPTREPDLPGGAYTSSSDYFYRDNAGDWHLTVDERATPVAYVGIKTDAIAWRLWRGDTGLHA